MKHFEYKKKDERGPLHEAMRLLLPLCYERMLRLLPDHSQHSALLHKFVSQNILCNDTVSASAGVVGQGTVHHMDGGVEAGAHGRQTTMSTGILF